MQLIPLGGASEIGGSCTLIEAFGAMLVVDYGLRPNAKEGKYPDLERIAEHGTPLALLVTHAHADHTGGLPLFHRRFPGVRIFATTPTVHITRTLLKDSVAIMERDWEGEVDFTQEDVDALNRVFVPVSFNTPIIAAATETVRVSATYVRAGHILGAAMIALEFEHLPTGQLEKVLVSGDVSGFDQPTIPGTDLDTVRNFAPTFFICEGTYGAEEHRNLELEEARFVARVAEVLRGGGRVVIPAFAVGRAQNVALILRDAQQNPERIRRILQNPDFTMPRTAIVLDGMCRTIADQYNSFASLLHPTLARRSRGKAHVFYDEGPDATLCQVTNPRQREQLLALGVPMVLIASSGMLNGGPSVRYAQAVANDPKSAILLCGYQDEESPGALLRRLAAQRGEGREHPVLTLGGETVELKCQVEQYSLSAHSDAADLERLLEAVQPQYTVLVHGTPTRLGLLQQRLEHFAEARGLTGAVVVAHRDEPVEADGRATFGRLTFPVAARHAPPRSWHVALLTGREAHGAPGHSITTPYITAALLHGRRRRLTEEEIARLTSLVPSDDPVDTTDIALTRETLQVGCGVVWDEATVGRERVLVPVGPADQQGFTQLARTARVKVSEALTRALHGAPDLPQHWERVRSLGIGVGDLVLFIHGGVAGARLLPAVTVAETPSGYQVIAPDAPEGRIAVNQIVVRVGPWPASEAMRAVPSQLEVRLLEAMGRALSGTALERLLATATEPPPDEHVDTGARIRAVLRSLVQRGVIEAPAVALGDALVDAGAADRPMHYTVSDLIARLGGEGRVSPAMLTTMLNSLAAAGILRVTYRGSTVELAWAPRVVEALTERPEAEAALRTLGGFEPMLRDAFVRAIGEIVRLGLVVHNNMAIGLGTGTGSVDAAKTLAAGRRRLESQRAKADRRTGGAAASA